MTVLSDVAPDPLVGPGMEGVEKPRSMFRRGLEVFLENKLAVIGVGILVFFVLFCFLGPVFYHSDQSVVNLDSVTMPPGSGDPLGTDQDGLDQLGKLMSGGQASLEVGFAAGAIAAIIGALYGAIAGYVGGWLDSVMMRFIDAALSFPTIFVLIYLSLTLGKTKLVMIGVIGLTGWFGITRLVRGESLAIKVRDYVAASRMMGGGGRRIVLRHILPNTIGTTIVNTTFSIADAIFALSSLSFLGLGLQPPKDDWGGMLNTGVGFMDQGYWWLIYPPGIAIILVIISFNFIGDALRDAFETRLQKR
jgi:peptide/nickel transport system permease protein